MINPFLDLMSIQRMGGNREVKVEVLAERIIADQTVEVKRAHAIHLPEKGPGKPADPDLENELER